ncbi:MAG: Mur ligase family protein [Acidobacteriota bacterium]
MNFKESINYLYELGNEVLAMKLGLENIGKLLNALGNPQENYLKVQVAGTNGKGSVCVFLEAICISAGIKVGMTISPHLVSVTERVRINGREISEKDFARHATRIREISEKLVKTGELETVPTYFEQVTTIALNAFSEAKIELAILETGLGGRFDATTAAKAKIAAITPIDFDHQQILGNTLAKIAAEKAAIIRADTKVVVAEQPKEALDVILQRCAKFSVSPNLAAEVGTFYEGETVTFQTSKAVYEKVRLSLNGRHQIENAKSAILLAEILQENFKITSENIVGGLQSAKHKGRLEFYKNFLFDGAHNVSGAKSLRQYLDEFITQPITMIFGSMRDKDLSEIAEILYPKADRLILTKPDNPRSMETLELLKFVPKVFGKENIIIEETVENAVKKAREISSENHLILITGSLYLIGEAQKILKNESGI